MKEETEKILVNTIIDLGVNMENLRKETKEQLAKTNLQLAENSRAILKLANGMDELRSDLNGKIDSLSSGLYKYAESNSALVSNHKTRITRLEEGSSYVVREPHVPYKRIKKKRKK